MDLQKLFSVLILLISFMSFSQTTIVEGDITKGEKPFYINFLDEKEAIAISYGENTTMSIIPKIKDIIVYYKSGKKEILIENDEVQFPRFSKTGKTLKVNGYSGIRGSQKFKFVMEGKESSYTNYKDLGKYDKTFFNDNNQFIFRNANGKQFKDFEKDELLLENFDIFSRESSKIKIQKPDISRLIGDNYVRPRKKELT